MDIETARKVLGVSSNTSPDEIKARYRNLVLIYHPDMTGGNTEQFMEICLAYMTLKGKQGGNKSLEEAAQALHLKDQINSNIQLIYKEYLTYKNDLYSEVEQYLKAVILSASSTTDLKKVLEGQVKEYLVEVSAQLEEYIKEATKSSSKQKLFLFNLFKSIYQKRRQLWLLNLYREPVVLVTSALQVARPFLKLPEVQAAYPVLGNIASVWWAPYALAVFVIIYLIIQYLQHFPES